MLAVCHFREADEGARELFFALRAVKRAEVAGQTTALATFHQHNRLPDVREEELGVLNQHIGGNEVVEEASAVLLQFRISREAGHFCHRHHLLNDAGKAKCGKGVGMYDCNHVGGRLKGWRCEVLGYRF